MDESLWVWITIVILIVLVLLVWWCRPDSNKDARDGSWAWIGLFLFLIFILLVWCAGYTTIAGCLAVVVMFFIWIVIPLSIYRGKHPSKSGSCSDEE